MFLVCNHIVIQKCAHHSPHAFVQLLNSIDSSLLKFPLYFERWMPVDRHKEQHTPHTDHVSHKSAGKLFNSNYIWYLNFTIKHALVYGSTQFQFSSQKGLNVSNTEMLEAFSVLFSGILQSIEKNPFQKVWDQKWSWKFYHVALVFHFIFSLLVARLCGNLLWFL